jgi:hypothetical protein
LQVGSSERTMTCSTDTGSTRTCTYTLTGSDDGSISILANKLTGTLSDLAGNAVASLSHSPVTSPSLSLDTSAPTITGIAFSNTGCASNLCGPTDVVNVDVTFSEAVTPSSTPPMAATIPVTIGGTTTYTAAYASQPSANVLRFTKTIAAMDSGETGALSTPANPTITLTAGTLQDSVGNTATLTSTLAAGSSGYTVDTTAPTVATYTPVHNATNIATNTTLSLTFGEAVTVSGTVNLVIKRVSDAATVATLALPAGPYAANATITTTAAASGLSGSIQYYVTTSTLDATNRITDTAGNDFAGITSDATWRFTTAAPVGDTSSFTDKHRASSP